MREVPFLSALRACLASYNNPGAACSASRRTGPWLPSGRTFGARSALFRRTLTSL